MSPSPEFGSSGAPGEESREHRREQLLDELDRNVGRVLKLQTIVDQEMFAPEPDKAIRQLKEFRDALWVDEPEEVIQIRDEWKNLSARRQTLNDSDRVRGEADVSEEQYQQLEQNEEEGDAIVKRLNEIEHDDRLLYLLSLDQSSVSLENKASRVADYRHDRNLLLRDAKSSLGREINHRWSEAGIDFKKEIKQVVFDTFGVTLIADQDFIAQVYEGAHGFHNEHSPFSFAADLGEATKRLINHERAHNMVDGSVVHGEPGSMISRKYKRMQKGKGAWMPDIIYQSERQSLLERLQRPGREQVDALHDELLAESSDLQFELNKNREMFLTPNAMKFPLSKSPAFRFFYDHASTAGWEAGQYVKTLEKITGDVSDPELAASAARAGDDFGEALSTMLKHVMEAGELGKQYGPGAERDVQAALYILRPSKYRHISSLLRHKYGTGTNFTGIN